jgi:hemolysin D
MAYSQRYERVASPTFHATLLFTIFVFLAILCVSYIFKVEVVARGNGRIVPVNRVQVVQSEFLGRISAIHVRNGSAVRKGDVLIELDSTEVASQLATITSEQERLQIESARIEAVATALSKVINDPGTLAKTRLRLPESLSHHPFADDQRALLRAQIDDLIAALAQNASRAQVNRLSENVTRARIDRVDAALTIQIERLQSSRTLFEKGMMSRSAYLDAQQAFTELERERAVFSKELEQKIAERSAIGVERRQVLTTIGSSLALRRTEISSRLATLSEDERVASRRLSSTRLEAPVAGFVDQLRTFTIGGITEAGNELLRIVPTDVELEIEGVFSNLDVGFLRVGQRANIRLDAFPSERFGFVTGSVSDIAADATEIKDGSWGYSVRVTLDQVLLKEGDVSHQLRPGMTAKIDVITDERRIISYFFAPILETVQDSLGER